MDPDTFKNDMISKLRTGRPRDNWLKETLKEYWDDILTEYTRNKQTNRTLHGIAPNTPLNLNNREHYYLIKAAANDNFFIDPQAFEVLKNPKANIHSPRHTIRRKMV